MCLYSTKFPKPENTNAEAFYYSKESSKHTKRNNPVHYTTPQSGHQHYNSKLNQVKVYSLLLLKTVEYRVMLMVMVMCI